MINDLVRNKKILYIHPVSGSGGATEALLSLVNELDKSKYYPKIYCPEFGDSYKIFKKNGIDVEVEESIKTFYHATAGWYSLTRIHKFIRDFFNIFYSAWIIYKRIKKEKPDIVHISSSVLLGPMLGAKLTGVPIVWHIREYLHSGYFGIRKWIITNIIDKLSDTIIAISKTDANRLKPSTKINVIYDSVDFNKFDRKSSSNYFKKEFNIKDNEKTVGMFGGISRIKGTIEFIEAAEMISKNNQNYKFFIFGDSISSSKNPIKKIVKKIIFGIDYVDEVLDLLDRNQDYIKFVGSRCDIPQIMAGLDLIVFPSTAPHSALPVIEASAMAKPVVASNWGEITEEVIHNKTGILVNPSDLAALSHAIENLLNNPALANAMGEEGYKIAKQNFDIKKNTYKIGNIYDKMLNRNENSSY